VTGFWASVDRLLNVRPDDPPDFVLRCRSIAAICVIFSLFAGALGVAGLVTEGLQWKRLLGPATIALYGGILWLMRRSRSTALPSVLLLAGNGATDLLYIASSGGLTGYASVILTSVPLAAALLLGTTAAAAVSAIAIAAVWALHSVAPGNGGEEALKQAVLLTVSLASVAVLSMALSEINRQLRARLAAARDEALAASQAKSRFLAIVSHEIRTPMNGVLGAAELLGRRNLPTEERRLVKAIDASGRSLVGLLDDILDMSKIEAGKLDVSPHPCRLDQLVEELAALWSAKAAERGVRFAVQIDPSARAWRAFDGARVRQCVSNLVSNALKFTSEGEVGVSVRIEDEAASVVVSDTGVGMDDAALSRLFQSFEQADASTARRYGGTGLGLAISRRLAVMMGGDISVRSEPGRGSVFTLTFAAPDAEEPERRSARPATARADALAGVRVLCVDDNRVNLQIAALMLNAAGAEAECAPSGAACLEALQGQSFDVVLLDLHMPGMDGRETLGRIRALPGDLRAVPVVAATADATAEDRAALLADGMDGYVSKPISSAALAAEIRRVLAAAPKADRSAA